MRTRVILFIIIVVEFMSLCYGFAQVPRGVPVIVDSISLTTVRLRWTRESISTQSVFLVSYFTSQSYSGLFWFSEERQQDMTTIATRDTAITLTGLRPNQLYTLVVTSAGITPSQNAFPPYCVGNTAFTTLSERFVAQIQSGSTHQWSGFVVQQAPRSDSTYYQLSSRVLDSLGYLTLPVADRLLGRMIDAGIAIDTAWVETGYGGLGSLCSRVVATVSYPGNFMIKLSRRDNRVEQFGFAYPGIFTVPRARQSNMNGETRRYVFPRSVSVQSSPQVTSALMVVPQPLSGNGECRVTLRQSVTADIVLTTLQGKTALVFAKGIALRQGENTIPLRIEGIASGVYAVQIVSGGRILHSQSVVVVR